MVLKSLSSAVLIAVTAVGSANAESVCETVDSLVGALSEIRAIHAAGYPALPVGSLQRLEGHLAEVSLDDLFKLPRGVTTDDSARQDALVDLHQNSQAALAAYRSGDSEGAAERLHAVIPQELSRSLSDLQRTSGCRPQPYVGAGLHAGSVSLPARLADTPSLTSTDARITTATHVSAHRNSAGRLASDWQARPWQIGKQVDNGINWLPLLALYGVLIAATLQLVKRNRRERERRQEERLICEFSAHARSGKRRFKLVIVDMTRTGLKLQHGGDIGRRRTIEVRIAGTWCKGRVSWRNPIYAGVRLARPLDDEQFEILRDHATAISRAADALSARTA